MKELCLIMQNIGLNNAKSYLNSGNLLFDSRGDTDFEEKLISKAILSTFGVNTPVLIFSQQRIHRIFKENPYNTTTHPPSLIHTVFVKDESRLKHLKPNIKTEDLYHIGSKAIYIFTPRGYHKTKINNLFWEKQLNTPTTARNLNTVAKLIQMTHD